MKYEYRSIVFDEVERIDIPVSAVGINISHTGGGMLSSGGVRVEYLVPVGASD